MGNVRIAVPSDYSSIEEWDEFWGDRRQEMQRAELYVYESTPSSVVGYLSLSRALFLNYPFISFLCVHEEYRRRGVGTALLEKVAVNLEGSKHFISTETDNVAAAELFKSAGFKFTGQLSDVNFDGTPEDFYVRGKLEHG